MSNFKSAAKKSYDYPINFLHNITEEWIFYFKPNYTLMDNYYSSVCVPPL